MNKQAPTKEEIALFVGTDFDSTQNYTLILNEDPDIEIYYNVPRELIEPYYNYITGTEYSIYNERIRNFKKEHPDKKEIDVPSPYTDNIDEFLKSIQKYKSLEYSYGILCTSNNKIIVGNIKW